MCAAVEAGAVARDKDDGVGDHRAASKQPNRMTMVLPAQQIRFLGPVDIVIEQTVHPVVGGRQRALLVALGLAAGQPVSTDWLIDVVWGEHGPATARNTLQRHVSLLRARLGDRQAIVATGPGY